MRVAVSRLTASGLALVAVCYGLARFAYGLFVPDFRNAFGMGSTLLGVVAAGSYVGYCAAVTVAAALVSRFGARAVAIAAGLVAATGMAVVALAPNEGILAAGVLIAGASTGMASPPLAEAVARWTPPRRHDRAQATVNAGPGAGIVVSAFVAVVAAGNWRAAWLGFSAIAVVVTVAIGRSVPPTPIASQSRAPSGLAAVARAVASWRLAGAGATFGAASAALWLFGPDHVARASGIGHSGAILWWIVLGVAEFGGLVAGDLSSRWGLRSLWTAGLTMIGIATAVLGLWPAQLVAAYSMAALFGAGYIALTTVVFLWGLRLHPDNTAASVAFGFLAIAAGQAVFSPVVGAFAARTSPAAAFVLCACLAMLAAFLLRPPTYRHELTPAPSANTRRT